MRTIDNIEAEYNMVKNMLPEGTTNTDLCELELELRQALIRDIPLDRLKEICNAERDGRLMVLPCKVGDTVYVISKCENVHMCRDDDYFTGTGAIECPFEKDCEFEECDDGNTRVFETTIRGGWVEENHICVFCDTLNFEIVQSDIGKTVFLTREEAEKALKGGAE